MQSSHQNLEATTTVHKFEHGFCLEFPVPVSMVHHKLQLNDHLSIGSCSATAYTKMDNTYSFYTHPDFGVKTLSIW